MSFCNLFSPLAVPLISVRCSPGTSPLSFIGQLSSSSPKFDRSTLLPSATRRPLLAGHQASTVRRLLATCRQRQIFEESSPVPGVAPPVGFFPCCRLFVPSRIGGDPSSTAAQIAILLRWPAAHSPAAIR